MKRSSKLFTWVYSWLGDEWTNLTVGFWVFAIGMFLFSVCHVVLLVSEGIDDISMWRYMRTVSTMSFDSRIIIQCS